MMIKRDSEKKLKELASRYSVVMLIGPRQSGKTTLCRNVFKNKPYVLLENPDQREYAHNDPRGFLAQFPDGAVFDEIQKVPELIEYLQGIVDSSKQKGLFILTGSQNLLLSHKITQSLAGRTAILNLLPFSFHEIRETISNMSIDEIIFTGFFPRIYDEHLPPAEALNFYFKTYIERDVRELINLKDLLRFQTFIRLCAARTGQVLNVSSLGNEAGVSHQTARDWLSLLEVSFIVFRLPPFHRNYNKRLVKSPKLYFYDVGLAAHLLEITTVSHVRNHPLRGNLFENMVVAELIKDKFNQAKENNLCFFRDSNENEVDIIDQQADGLTAVEIKSSQTITPGLFKGLNYLEKISKDPVVEKYVIYGGDISQKRTNAHVLGFRNYYRSLHV
ncbi:MAG: ATP-binding protein [Candidatus Omnitrophota bacterium]